MAEKIQRSFAGGELSPSLHARADLVRYQNGGKKFLNWQIGSDGGAINRAGWVKVTKTKIVEIASGLDAHSKSRYVKFEGFRQTDNLGVESRVDAILELGENFMRFHMNGAPIVTGGFAWDSVTEWETGQVVLHNGICYYCLETHTNHEPPNSTYWYPLEVVTADSGVLEIPTEWTQAEVERLQWEQDGFVMTFVDRSGRPWELTAESPFSWILAQVPKDSNDLYFYSEIAPVTNLTQSGAAGSGYKWYVAPVTLDGEEGSELAEVTGNTAPTAGSPIHLQWTASADAYGYNIYRFDGSGLGFLGFTTGVEYYDRATTTDLSELPPSRRIDFADNAITQSQEAFPTVITKYQQRRLLAGINAGAYRGRGWASRIRSPRNFDRKIPVPADGAFEFECPAEVIHMRDVGVLVAWTTKGEIILKGDGNGVLRPGEINPQFYSYNGASALRPLLVGSNALYVQKVGQLIRDLGFNVDSGSKEGYRDLNLTANASHMVDGFTIVDWCFQKTPHPTVWAVRSDGKMIGITYDREQQILAFHLHETDGTFERVVDAEEGDEHAVYAQVKRTLEGQEVRFLERQAARNFTDIRDAIFVDCAYTFDGRNPTRELAEGSRITMKICGASDWGYGQEMDLVCSSEYFEEAHVGDVFQVKGKWTETDEEGIETEHELQVACLVTGFVDAETLKVRPDLDIPEGMQELECDDWARAINELTGLDDHEGLFLSVIGDGKVIASPNNPAYAKVKCFDGKVPLGAHYGVVHAGRPYVSDFESLNLEVQQGTVANKRMLVNEVTAFVEKTRGLFWGTQLPTAKEVAATDQGMLHGLEEMPVEGVNLEGPIPLKTGKSTIKTQGVWDFNAQVVARQVDPLPAKIGAIVPTGFVPGGG